MAGPSAPSAQAVALLDGLVDVPEASWGSSRWRLSDRVAVMDQDVWDRRGRDTSCCVLGFVAGRGRGASTGFFCGGGDFGG
ncbi:hypothetical protein BCL76_10466 [Streptomyces sp. CG 926]|nr:hypothetical protein BCL76_10466 [Streptomyces sp. CG 926]